MKNLRDSFNELRLAYQRRYCDFLGECRDNPKDMMSKGHMLECSYVLIFFFGLTDKEVREIEHNNGFTNFDLED